MSLIGPEGKKQLKLASRASAVGIELVLAILAGYFAGSWADRRFDTAPVLTYVGLALGLLAAANAVWNVVRRTNFDRL